MVILSWAIVSFPANSGGYTNLPLFQGGGMSGNAFGGAVFARGSSVFSSNVTFHANNAQVPSTYSGSAGSVCGGALYISNSLVELVRGFFVTNAASGGGTTRSRGGLAQGGAIYN